MPLLLLALSMDLAAAEAPAQMAQPWIGIGIAAGPSGVLVTAINAGTPAEAAGMQVGDEVLRIDGVAVAKPDELRGAVLARGVGMTVRLDILRGGKPITLDLALAAKPAEAELLRSQLVGKPVPVWALSGHDGPFDPSDFASLRGHVVIVDFWATWCGPCRATMPVLSAWYRAHESQGLRVVGVTSETVETVRSALAKDPVPYALAYDSGTTTTGGWHVGAIPMIAVVDAEGIVRYAGIGSGSNVVAAGKVAASLLGLPEL